MQRVRRQQSHSNASSAWGRAGLAVVLSAAVHVLALYSIALPQRPGTEARRFVVEARLALEPRPPHASVHARVAQLPALLPEAIAPAVPPAPEAGPVVRETAVADEPRDFRPPVELPMPAQADANAGDNA